MVPPIPNPEQVGHFMHGIKAGRPEIPWNSQVSKSLEVYQTVHPESRVFGPSPARSQEQDITEALFIPQHKGISPSRPGHNLPGREGQCVFLPLLQVIAYGMHHDLRSFSPAGDSPGYSRCKRHESFHPELPKHCLQRYTGPAPHRRPVGWRPPNLHRRQSPRWWKDASRKGSPQGQGFRESRW